MIRMMRRLVQLIARKKEPVTDRSEFMRGWMAAADFVYRHQCETSSTESTRTLCQHVLQAKHENIAFGQGWEQFVDDMLNRLKRPSFFPNPDERLGSYRTRIEQSNKLYRAEVAAEVELGVRTRIERQERAASRRASQNRRVRSPQEELAMEVDVAAFMADGASSAAAEHVRAEKRGFDWVMATFNSCRGNTTFPGLRQIVDRWINEVPRVEQPSRLAGAYLAGMERGWDEVIRLVELQPNLLVVDPEAPAAEPGSSRAATRRALRS